MTDQPHAPTSEQELVSEQLWPAVERTEVRISGDDKTFPGWRRIEQHRVIGARHHIDVVLPTSRILAVRALLSYSGLRPPKRRLTRALVAILAGLPLPIKLLSLEVRTGDAPNPATVVSELRASLRQDIAIAMHVRRSANRKALLQVVSLGGETLGFAKVARDELTSAGIRTETAVLAELGGGSKVVRSPRVLVAGENGSLPYVLTEPLPRDIRLVSSALTATPSFAEFAAVAPVVRSGCASGTAHIQRMRLRSERLRQAGTESTVLDAVDRILREIDLHDEAMMIAKWWHGDFAYWNVGRNREGTLWCWDYENVDYDALAGLDVIHWHASRRRDARGAAGVGDRRGILADSAEALRTFGNGSPKKLNTLYRAYIAEIGLRTLETVESDGWSRVWTTPQDLERLMRQAIQD